MNFALRLSCGAAAGVFADLFAIGDAYGYTARIREPHNVALACGLLVLLLVPAALNLRGRRTFAIAAAVWGGMVATHTAVLIAETSHDPTSHNLWPFEYLFICMFALVGLIGPCWGVALRRY